MSNSVNKMMVPKQEQQIEEEEIILLNDQKQKERNKRAKMNQNYSVLQSMVPSLIKSSNKPSQEKIVTEATEYIRYLEDEAKRLETLKKRKQFKEQKSVLSKSTNPVNSSSNVAVSNDATFLAVQLPARRGLVPEIVKVIQKHRAEVLEARVCVSDQRILTFTSTILLNGGSTIDKIKGEILFL